MLDLRSSAAFVLCAMLLAGCGAQPLAVKAVPQADVKGLAVGEKPAPLFFRKIVVDIPDNSVVGTYQAGLICAGGRNLRLNAQHRTITKGHFPRIFKEEFEKANYVIVGDREDLFREPSSSGARFMVGGRMKELKMNFCMPNVYNLSAARGQSYMRVEWQVFDRKTNKIVFRTVKEGSHRIDSAISGGFRILFRTAFRQTVRALIADPEFRTMITNPGLSGTKT